jgi:hypothetical protein
MRKLLLALCVAAPLALGGCVDDGYGGGVAVGYGAPYAYQGYYDDYYGPFYDGYWGGDGYFYYRSTARDRHFRRGDPHHFRRDSGGDHFREMRGNFTPQPGMRMPHWNGGNAGGPQGRGRRHGG